MTTLKLLFSSLSKKLFGSNKSGNEPQQEEESSKSTFSKACDMLDEMMQGGDQCYPAENIDVGKEQGTNKSTKNSS